MKLFLLVAVIPLATVMTGEQINLRKAFAQYSGELYSEVLKTQPGSFVICTPSIQTGLGLIYSGAKGDSATQISTSLHLPDEPKEFQDVIHQISKNLRTPKNSDFILNSANIVYIDNDFKINTQYKKTLEDIYDADIANVDFSKKPEAAAEINKWIEGKTHNKIQNMIKEDQLDGVRAALVNAMYFQGKWVKEFNSELTKNELFYADSKTSKSLEIMQMGGHFSYYESPSLRAQFLELPYKGENITMTFVLPLDRFGLSGLESRINEVIIAPQFTRQRVIMAIPKFKIDSSIDLVPVLAKLGVTDIFSKADLTGMTENKEPLKIGAALQRAVIEVDEKGTVATAAFVGFAVPLSSHYVQPPTYYFTADQPFIYYIKVNDIIMFIGRYTST